MMLRWVTASAVFVSGLVHLWLWWFDGFAEIDVIGPLFLLNAVAGVVLAVATVASRHWLPLLASVGFGAATLGAFVVSTTVGLFGVQERWSGAPVWIAAVSEAVAVLAGGLALVTESREVRSSRSGVELEQRTS